MGLETAASLAICLVTVWAALLDVAARSIPNRAPAALVALGLPVRIHDSQAMWALAASTCVFALAFFAWRRGWMGGGDVKMFAAGAMTAPPWLVPSQILAISLAGGVLGLVYLLLRRFSPRPAGTRPASRVGRILRAERWRIRRGASLPYGCAICAGIVFTLLQG